MADVKQIGGKWYVVSDSGKKKEEVKSKAEGIKRLKEWEGHKYRSEGKKPKKKKSSELLITRLAKLANELDMLDPVVADEIDTIIRNAVQLPPEKEKELDEQIDSYFADTARQERNLMEKEYGLDEDDMFGLEPVPWHGHKWSYEGFPKDKAEHFKRFERYQTVIADGDEAPESIEDPVEGGVWEREQVFDKPEGATKGTHQAVYRFVPSKELSKRLEPKEDDSALRRLLDEPDEVEVTEEPEDIVESKEKPPAGGGVHLF